MTKNAHETTIVEYLQIREQIPQVVREAILTAYNHKCQYCGDTYNRLAQCVDHIIPITKPDLAKKLKVCFPNNNLNCLENLIASCEKCNSKKHNLSLPIGGVSILLAIAEKNKGKVINLLNDKGFRYRDPPPLTCKELSKKVKTKLKNNNIYYYPTRTNKEIRTLIDSGADIFSCGSDILYWTIYTDDRATFRKIINNQAYVNSYNRALRYSIRKRKYFYSIKLAKYSSAKNAQNSLKILLKDNMPDDPYHGYDIVFVLSHNQQDIAEIIRILKIQGADLLKIEERLFRKAMYYLPEYDFNQRISHITVNNECYESDLADYLLRLFGTYKMDRF